MVRLSRTDISDMAHFNDLVFLSDAKETRIKNLEYEIRDARNELIRLMRELDLEKQRPVPAPVTETSLLDFFAAHPAMTLSYEDGKITLKSSNQSVAFHTRRERNAVGINNDIIYATLPLYSFSLDFFPDGNVVGRAEKSTTLEQAWDAQVHLTYGHPHTRHRSNSRAFESLCNGDNRFIQDWSHMRNNGIMDGGNTLRILSQAAIWMETANISDMYRTALAEGPHVPENIIADMAVDGLFYCKKPIGEGAPILRFIFDAFGGSAYRMALWSLWIVKHLRDLPDCLGRCACLYQAALYDAWIILKKPDAFGNMRAASRAEIDRVLPIAMRCYQELGGYKPDYSSSDRTISQIKPELFPENFNPSNMEDYNVSITGPTTRNRPTIFTESNFANFSSEAV